MTIRQLISGIGPLQVAGQIDHVIGHICFDSRNVQPGDLFVALTGSSSNGHDFIDSSVEKGAVAVICEYLPVHPRKGITYVKVNDSAKALGIVAAEFFGNPSQKLSLTGVTGTNGKTTTATLLFELFRSLGYGAGLISTITNRINDTIIPATHTTPDPVQLNSMMARMVEAGCSYCFMEVSSHAIDQQRIAGLTFKGGIFTNLTHDHLDYHKTFDAYLRAKKKFFDGLDQHAFAVVNKDDRNGMVMVQNTKASVHTCSLQSLADFRCRIIENQLQGLHLNLDGHDAWFKLSGRFNASNLLSVYATAILLGQEPLEVITCLSGLSPVNGRFNYVVSSRNVTAIVDYAHTPDALKNVLETIQEVRTRNEKLITVVGAGGNRDTSKRPVMARIASTLSDRVILTSDNPRNEDPQTILNQMKEGIDPPNAAKVLTIVNRLEAIRTACALAHPGDIILVAGKGHETYQEINGIRNHFDDREVLENIFSDENNINP